jgi:hypothetical protein
VPESQYVTPSLKGEVHFNDLLPGSYQVRVVKNEKPDVKKAEPAKVIPGLKRD